MDQKQVLDRLEPNVRYATVLDPQTREPVVAKVIRKQGKLMIVETDKGIRLTVNPRRNGCKTSRVPGVAIL